MGFTKLHNPKPGALSAPHEGVAVSCRKSPPGKARAGQAAGPRSYAVIRVGPGIARKAGFNGQGKADVVVGDGLERLRCGITAAEKGEFKLTKLKSGEYQVTIPERAATGVLNMQAPRFIANAELVPIATGLPPCVMFDLTKEMREP